MSCLIVTSPTADHAGLDRAVRDRIAAGDHSFYVLVPRMRPSPGGSRRRPTWAFGLPVATGPEPAAVAEARARSERQLDLVVATIHAAGGEADGEVSGPDLVGSLRKLVMRREFEEIIVSGARPQRRRSLSARVSRAVDVPVTTLGDAA